MGSEDPHGSTVGQMPLLVEDVVDRGVRGQNRCAEASDLEPRCWRSRLRIGRWLFSARLFSLRRWAQGSRADEGGEAQLTECSGV